MLVGINIFLISLYFLTYYFQKKLIYKLVQEDGILENFQALFFLVAAVALLIPVIKKRIKTPDWQKYLWSSALMFAFLEEISYGQRLFGWRWTWLQANNHQYETNLHNMLPLHGSVNAYLYFILTIAIIIPLLEYWGEQRKYWGKFLSNRQFIGASLLLGGFYLALPKNKHPFFYEYTELMIALNFVLLIGKHYSVTGKTQSKGSAVRPS